MPLEPDRIFYELGHLLNEMPDMNTEAWQTPEGQRWFGRVAVLIREMGELPDYVSFNMAVENLHSIRDYPRHVQEITAILNRTLAQAELRATPAARAAFIPVGEVFAAFATVSRIVAEARSCVMFVSVHSKTSCHPADFRPRVTSHSTTRGYFHEKTPHRRTVASPNRSAA